MFHQMIKNWIFLKSTRDGLLKNVKDEIFRPLGSRKIQKTKVCTVLWDTLYYYSLGIAIKPFSLLFIHLLSEKDFILVHCSSKRPRVSFKMYLVLSVYNIVVKLLQASRDLSEQDGISFIYSKD